jgi:hypothetical protein
MTFDELVSEVLKLPSLGLDSLEHIIHRERLRRLQLAGRGVPWHPVNKDIERRDETRENSVVT